MSELVQSVVTWLGEGVGTLGGIVLTAGVVSAVVTKLFDRGAKRDERVRDGYADSTAVLVAWGEFPFRVARRTSDEPDVCAGLVARAHDAQEALACRRAWVVGESVVMSEAYAAITAQLRPQVAEATKAAWRRAPATTGAGMVLSDGQPMPNVAVQRFVDLWCLALPYRFGWRRWVFVPALLRWVLRRRGCRFVADPSGTAPSQVAARDPMSLEPAP